MASHDLRFQLAILSIQIYYHESVFSGKLGPYVRINKEFTVENNYPREFVRNVSEKKETDYRPLIELLLN